MSRARVEGRTTRWPGRGDKSVAGPGYRQGGRVPSAGRLAQRPVAGSKVGSGRGSWSGQNMNGRQKLAPEKMSSLPVQVTVAP